MKYIGTTGEAEFRNDLIQALERINDNLFTIQKVLREIPK